MRRASALLAAAMVLAGLAAPVAAHADSGPAGTLHVDRADTACTDSGTGTAAAPFCTVQAAANVVRPGDVVEVAPGSAYPETVTLTRSGTADAPVTFVSAPDGGAPFRTSGFVVSGASHVVIDRLGVAGGTVEITGSSDVTVEHSSIGPVQPGTIGFHVTGASSSVRLERSSLWGTGEQVVVDQGSSGTDITTNELGVLTGKAADALISVAGATGTAVTSNSVVGTCGTAVAVSGAATQTTVENNVTDWDYAESACAGTSSPDISVAADAAAGTHSGYNVLYSSAQQTLYDWAGSDYASIDAFRSATGQGAHDLVGEVRMSSTFTPEAGYGDLTVDDADASAPGELPSDFSGTARTDDPDVTDTGTGAGTYDRGAVELTDVVSDTLISGRRSIGANSVEISGRVSQSWRTATAALTLAWGDGTTSTATTTGTQPFDVRHTYGPLGTYTGTVTATVEGITRTQRFVFDSGGSGYTAVTPVRLVDTRDGTGTGGVVRPLPAGGTLKVTLPMSVPEAGAAAVVNITVVNPRTAGFIEALPDGSPDRGASDLNFTRGAVVANTATVGLDRNALDLVNHSTGTTDLVVDLEGYYTLDTGLEYHPLQPVRLLDTRSGLGAASAAAVPAHSAVTVRIAGSGGVPASAAGQGAVTLNLTETGATAAGYVEVYPTGVARPTASNVNFAAGQTAAGVGQVPIGSDGTVTLYNGSSRPIQLIADLEGYYSATGGLALEAVPPTRQFDTRTAGGCGCESAHGTLSLSASAVGGRTPRALVLNLTATETKAAGFLSVYPTGTTRPVGSSVNFAAGQTVANLAVATLGSLQGTPSYEVYNGSPGTTAVIVDLQGYFF